ncbi:SpoIIE family protein phosphatase [Streptomyces sp. NPDC058391]|uniref:ATP-binding SpoIIE family protein phosphatase n=1 Tax=Streptomyces sp. NPDC058391 TaxID=3346476 RepID=UPI003651E0AD
MAEQVPRDMDAASAARLNMITKAGDELGGADLLGFALDHAVTEVGGLGGMVHLRGPGGRGLLLMAAHGLVRTVAQDWEEIEETGPTAPARAVTDGTTVWVPAHDGGGGTDGHDGGDRTDREPGPVSQDDPDGPDGPDARDDTDGGDTVPGVAPGHLPYGAAHRERGSALPAGSGLLAVPLLTPGGVAGALSVLAVDGDEPTPRQRATVEALAAWAALRLREHSVTPRAADAGQLWEQPPDTPLWEQPPATPLRQALQAVRVGSWEWELATGEQIWDEPTLTLLGMDPSSPKQRFETWTSLVQPDDLPWVLVEVEQAIRNRRVFSVEYRICRPDGTTGWVNARGRVLLGQDGEPSRMVGTLWDTTESRIARDSVSRALRHMSDAFFAVGRDWRITFVNVEAERLLGASHTLLGRVLWDAFAAVSVDVVELGLETRYREAAESGTPVGFDVRWPTNQHWYHMRLVPVPDGLTVYAADVTQTRSREAERTAAEHAAAERNARITELTNALAEALTMHDVVNAAAERVMQPFGATGLVVQLIQDETIRVAGAVGYPQAFLDSIDGSAVGAVGAVEDAFRSRKPAFISSVEEYVELYPESAERPAEAEKRAWAFLPLIVSGRGIGCCVISFNESRHLIGEERALLTALSGLMAQAIERARLYDTEHTRAQELQRGLLPHALPTLHAVTAAARYLPASEGIDVGGDWYDVIPLSGARVALVIGDVMGHGLSEAATMGRLRTAVHTLADLEFPPAELLTRLNDVVNDLGDDFFATCLYAVYDPATSTCTFARAGHPPPAILHPGGTVQFLDHSPDPPLGAARPPFETVEVSLPEGSLLVLYTDGLVESATRDIDRGMEQLASTLAGAAPGPGVHAAGTGVHAAGTKAARRDIARGESESLERLCDDVLAALLPEKQLTDDAALLIARTHATAPCDIATWRLSDGPIAAGEARDHVREQLTRWDLDTLTMTAELLVSELVGNAIRYGKGPIGLRLLLGEGLICEVSDGSLTTPRIRHASDTDEGGRGLQLVAALSQRWGTRYTATGKCIWTEQQVP